jgi:hypothetical protein
MNTAVVKTLAEIRQLFNTAASEAEQAQIIEANIAIAKKLPDGNDRTHLLLGLRELAATVQTQCDTSTTSDEREHVGMDLLAKMYLSAAIQSLTRLPSPKLKSDFRATLNHWRSLMIMALKNGDEPTAFTHTVMAVVETEGAFDALRMIRNVSQQLLWQAAVQIQRDRRSQADIGDQSTFNDGESTHEDVDAEQAPTEDEVIDSYTEAHAWLSNMADLLATNEDDRVRLGLESGLEYTQVKRDDGEWVRVYDLSDAIEAQIEKNTDAMKRREASKILAQKAAFEALARLAA